MFINVLKIYYIFFKSIVICTMCGIRHIKYDTLKKQFIHYRKLMIRNITNERYSDLYPTTLIYIF